MAASRSNIANLPGSSQLAGDKAPQHVLITDSLGNLIETFGGTGGTSQADGSTHTANTTLGTPMQGVYESTPSTLTTGKVGTIGLTANREVKVSVTSGSASGTEYTEGDVDTTFTGPVVLMETSGNAAVPLQGSAADGLTVNLGANNDVTVTGSVSAVGAGTLATNQVTITTGATQIVASRSGRRSVTVMQLGTTAVYIGASSGVTTSNGILLVGTAGAAITLDYTGAVYGIVASGTDAVAYAEEY